MFKLGLKLHTPITGGHHDRDKNPGSQGRTVSAQPFSYPADPSVCITHPFLCSLLSGFSVMGISMLVTGLLWVAVVQFITFSAAALHAFCTFTSATVAFLILTEPSPGKIM